MYLPPFLWPEIDICGQITYLPFLREVVNIPARIKPEAK
jgi:hypothetical protein